ncbi:MAG TPA: PIG-L family deacetylase [Phycisphaerae bacterium]|nr:PIG-L family deacetylase [Phycisphaerae bacterium]
MVHFCSRLAVVFPCALLLATAARAADAGPATQPAVPPMQILQDLKAFASTGSVLYIAAHPDDENTQLLTYLARGRHYRTAYLSLTRGDGGQNLLGPEFGAELGLIRTEELLAARRLDSAQQFFSRALDFGFSKRADETLRIWDQNAITADIVRVIRTFRPDVLITRFNPDIPGGVGTHGHHTASAILARNAFNLLAKDPNAFPDQLTPAGGNLQPWQPKRIFMNMGGPGGRGGGAVADTVRMDISGTDAVRNIPYTQIAAESRAQHKSQGFGQGPGGGGGFGGRGGGAAGPRYESFTLLAGDPAKNDIMDGIDTTFARFQGGDQIATLTDAAIHNFKPDDPAASVPALLDIRKKLAALPDPNDPRLAAKRDQLDHLLAETLGLRVTTLGPATATPGDTLHLTCTAALSANFPIQWLDVSLPGIDNPATIPPTDLHPDQTVSRPLIARLSTAARPSQPYWLREESLTGLFQVEPQDQHLIGRPENPPAFPIIYTFSIGGQTLRIQDQPVQLPTASSDSRTTSPFPRQLEILAPVSLAYPFDVTLLSPGQSKPVSVQVTANTDSVAGALHLDAPQGWKVSPASQSFTLAAKSATADFAFTITAPPQPTPTPATFTAVATINGHDYSTGYKTIDYPHIPFLTLQPPAHLHALALDLKCTAKTIAYLPGAGDSVAECIGLMGCKVTQITGKDLTPETLRKFDAVVLGVRALNVRTDLGQSLQGLFDYANNGGTVIVQYNRPDGIKVPRLAPYDLRLSSNRVTDENAPVTFLAPDSPALNSPNKITTADFDNWVQERGIYYPSEWAKEFTPILSAADPGENQLPGALLIAPVGKGHYVYTSLVFFRQLPAPNPGAYRLFANLLSLGKK